MLSIEEKYKKWMDADIPQELRSSLQQMSSKEIEECFYKDLEFGTGGLRGILGPGSNRLNIFVIRKVTTAFALYLLKTYDPSNYGYDSPICFNTSSSNMVASGIWKYTIPTGYNMARVRFNSYANESNKVTCKLWDTMLIPERYYITPSQLTNTIALRVGKDYISTGKLYEI